MSRQTLLNRVLVGLLFCTVFSVWSCKEREKTPESVPVNEVAEEEEAEETGPPENQDEKYLAFVDEVEGKLAEALLERAARDEFRRGVQARFKAASEHSAKRAKMPEEKRPPRDLWYDETLGTHYSEREWEPIFTRGGRLKPWAVGMLGVFNQSGSHAMDPEDYWVSELSELLTKSLVLSDSLVNAPGLQLYERERHALSAFLQLKEFDTEADDAVVQVVDMLISEGEGNPVPRIKGAYDLFRLKQQDLTTLGVELEVRFADAFTRYIRDMSHKNLNRLTAEERKKYGDEVHPKYHSEIVINRLKTELDAVQVLNTMAEGQMYLEELWPPHEQYKALREALVKYRGIVDGGGWPHVEPVKLNKGGRSATVRLLKERLKAEGYYEGTVDDFYDEALGDAIALYQETHQMEITGEPTSVFWRSLNISAEERLAEIETNLERWRETLFVKSDYYVYINVPDFHAELWKNGERKMRFKIVVGNTKRKCGRNGKWYYPNATPLQHAKLEYLVFNPYWNVPLRIAREEYEQEINKDPDWLEENRFEFHTDKAGGTVLRQMPGPDNALGRVKFIFPNRHNTYMHDTPKTQFFEYPVRAFSHGCMRVEEPMELAETILAPESKWDDKEIFGYLKENDETQVDLEKPIDVFIEYYTVRVDEFGRTHFLADIYKYIRPLSGLEARCNPAAGDDGTVVPAGADFGP